MELGLTTWTQFKATCIALKNLNNQYVDLGSNYRLIGPDSNSLNWILELPKLLPDGSPNPDAVDFIANYSSAFNYAIGDRQYPFSTSDYEFMPGRAGPDTCPAGESKAIFFKIVENCRLNGGKLITDGNAAFGDWVEMACVDHDNLLGYGVDFVLKAWVPSWGVDWKACSEEISTPYAGAPPTLMYLRAIYHSVGASPVGFSVNYRLHRPI